MRSDAHSLRNLHCALENSRLVSIRVLSIGIDRSLGGSKASSRHLRFSPALCRISWSPCPTFLPFCHIFPHFFPGNDRLSRPLFLVTVSPSTDPPTLTLASRRFPRVRNRFIKLHSKHNQWLKCKPVKGVCGLSLVSILEMSTSFLRSLELYWWNRRKNGKKEILIVCEMEKWEEGGNKTN